MTKDWVHGVCHSSVCQILLQIVMSAVITSSSPAWTSSAGMLSTQLTSLSSMIVLQPPLLCEGWGGHPLCLSGYSLVLMDLHRRCSCTAQSSNQRVILALWWPISTTFLLWGCWWFSSKGEMLPVSRTRQHAPTPPQHSPLRRGACAWEQRSSTWHHRSGLGAQSWTSNQPPGSKYGA